MNDRTEYSQVAEWTDRGADTRVDKQHPAKRIHMEVAGQTSRQTNRGQILHLRLDSMSFECKVGTGERRSISGVGWANKAASLTSGAALQRVGIVSWGCRPRHSLPL